MRRLDWLWHVRGAIELRAGVDQAAFMARLAERLREKGCEIANADGRLLLSRGSSGQYSALAFANGGEIWLDRRTEHLLLRYDLSTLSNMALVGAGMACAEVATWFHLVPVEWWFPLAGFVWLYGANFAMAQVSVKRGLARAGAD